MAAETVCIPTEKYTMLKRKKAIADDLILQLRVLINPPNSQVL